MVSELTRDSTLLARSERLARILETVQEIGMAERDLGAVMRLIVERTRQLTGGNGAAIAMPDGDSFQYVVGIGTMGALERRRFLRTGSIAGVSFASGSVTHCTDALADNRVNRDLCMEAHVRSVLCVPLQHRGQVFAVLEMAAFEPDVFDDYDVEAMELMAGFLSATMAHARDYEEKQALVAERTAAVSALEESQRLFRSAFHASAVAMSLTTPSGDLLKANSALCDLLGQSEEALLASPITALLAPDGRPEDQAAIRQLLAGERDSLQQEVKLARADSGSVWVLLTASLARDHAGVPTQLVWQMPDITERKWAEAERQKLQDQLAQSQKMQAVGQLVSGVAHELNNPLAAILGFAEMLLADSDASVDREALTLIHDQAQRSSAIVRDLLAFVRQREGRRPQSIDTGELLRNVARALHPAAEKSGVTLELNEAGGFPRIDADGAGLEQVITNLVMNGIQAAGPGGRVVVSTGSAASCFEVVVEDTGSGIPPELLPHIFEPFFTTKPVGLGTGLGLPVSLGIVEQHGGSLTVVNRAASEGGGARFTASIPVMAPGCETDASLVRDGSNDAASVSPSRTVTGESAAPGMREPRIVTGSVSGSATPGGRRGFPASGPVRRPAVGALANGPAALRPAAGAPARAADGPVRRVLVVDDELPIRAVLRRYFTRKGWDFEEAEDGASALVKLLPEDSTERYDLIICDLRMPGLSGVEMYEVIATRKPELLTRIVFATGDVMSPEASTFLASINCPMLEKPYELSLLDEAVARVLNVVGSTPH